MLADPAGCLRSRWRSSPWKQRNDATPRGRGQKAPSTRRCIKTHLASFREVLGVCQKAPSTRRCIKTCEYCGSRQWCYPVRKHPAPEGALRPLHTPLGDTLIRSQKAPSTRRCIKTQNLREGDGPRVNVRKHPAPEGALRHDYHKNCNHDCCVRKHPAPEGALRPVHHHFLRA